MEHYQADPVPDAPRSHHGEGPVWDDASQRLWWTDVLDGVVHRARVEDGTIRHERSYEVDGTVGAVIPAAAGGVILLADDGYALLAEDGTTRRLLDLPTERRGITRMNDGGCDPSGRLWAGTMAFDGTPGRGTLYRTDLDGSTRVAVPATSISNGVGWNEDGSAMLFVDSGPRTVSRIDLDVDTGVVRTRATAITIEGPAAPDGLAMDDDGCAWVAMWGAGEVRRYAWDGELLAVVHVPTSQPSSVAFAGRDRDLLIISTSRVDLDDARLDAEPSAGLLHVAQVGVRGPAAVPYAGPVSNWRFTH